MKKLILFVAFITSIIWIPAGIFLYSLLTEPTTEYSVTMLSLSSDGRYVVGNKKNELYLWDIERKTRQRIAKNINIYSPYFIKNTPYYLFQDLDNTVYVKSVKGETIKTFPLGFASYGNLMTSDLSRYFASDIDYQIIKVEDGKKSLVKGLDDPGGFYSGKLLNLSLSSDDCLLLSVGFCGGPSEPGRKVLFYGEEIPQMKWPEHQSCTALWDTITNKPQLVFRSLTYKSTGVLSPDSKYIIGTDENHNVAIIDISLRQYIKFKDVVDSVLVYSMNSDTYKGEVIKPVSPPKTDYDTNGYSSFGYRVLFITPTEYLKFNTNFSYAFLYEINNVIPQAYLDLGTDPFPSVHDYSRNGSIDTAPAVHRVVTGKRTEPGIMVYDYDPEAKTLTKIWDAQ